MVLGLKAVLNRIRCNFLAYRNPISLRIDAQSSAFAECGLEGDRDLLISKLNLAMHESGLSVYNDKDGMFSDHLLIFTALSISSHSISRILEIGTYDGRTALTLSALFPDAQVTTIDLADDDPIFKDSYGRNNDQKREKLLSEREKNLKKRNIFFRQVNSLSLTFDRESRYDLIWVDGAHGVPVVTSDITNCLRLLEDNGFLLCDDVYTELPNEDGLYRSTASWKTLRAFENAGMITLRLLKKRISKEFISDKKYLALARLK